VIYPYAYGDRALTGVDEAMAQHAKWQRTAIPIAPILPTVDAVCFSRNGVPRKKHEPDKDRRCVFCDRRIRR
jgi:hypothetical protein